jgi:hypothetical protein
MSFLRDFMEYNSGNECPRPYVLWTGYGLLSAAMGRRIRLEVDWLYITPDLYILIIGDTGSKKTAAMDIGLDILRRAVPDISLSGDNETYQGIITYLDSDNSTRFYANGTGQPLSYKPYCIFASELMDYLQLNPVAMVTFLTGVYGRKAYIYRLKNEDRVLENPYVMMCACSTPTWLTDQIKAKQFAEGYGRRSIIACGAKVVRKQPIMTPEHRVAGERCVERLKQCLRICGPMLPTKEAIEWFWKWYTALKDPEDFFIKNWYSTLNINLLKVAMLTSVSERDDRVITLDHMQLSLELLREVEKNLPMVTERLGRSEIVEPAIRLKDTLRNNGGKMLEKELKMTTLKNFKNTLEQWQVFEWLKQTGQIAAVPEGGKVWIVLVKQPEK